MARKKATKRGKRIIIIAGPNGAGKTTFARTHLTHQKKKLNADTLAVWESLKIAAKNARKLAEELGTPFYVFKNGKIVDLNHDRIRSKAANSRKSLRPR